MFEVFVCCLCCLSSMTMLNIKHYILANFITKTRITETKKEIEDLRQHNCTLYMGIIRYMKCLRQYKHLKWRNIMATKADVYVDEQFLNDVRKEIIETNDRINYLKINLLENTLAIDKLNFALRKLEVELNILNRNTINTT